MSLKPSLSPLFNDLRDALSQNDLRRMICGLREFYSHLGWDDCVITDDPDSSVPEFIVPERDAPDLTKGALMELVEPRTAVERILQFCS